VGTRNPVGPVATVFPEFIARDGQERADGGRQGNKRRVGAARRRSRGHGPARLDGTRTRATVADKVMRSGKTAGHGNGPPRVLNRTQAKRAGPDRGIRAGGVSDGSPKGARLVQRGSMRSTTARPAVSWPGTPRLQEVPESQPIDKGSGTDKPALVKYAAKRLQHQERSMSSPQTTNPQQAREAIRIQGRRYNLAHGLLPTRH